MPFPFHRLHNFLQSRLRELVTPSQLYQIQVALGDTRNFLGPLQFSCKTKDKCFLVRNAQNVLEIVHYVNDDNHNGNAVTIYEKLCVQTDVRETDVEFPHFIDSHALLNVKELRLLPTSFLDASAVKKLASLYSKECHSLMCRTMVLETDVTMQLMFTLFPNLKSLDFPVCHTDNWLDDFLEIKVPGLAFLRIKLFGSPYEVKMFCHLNVKLLYKLCKAHQPNFLMELCFYTNENIIASTFWNFFKPYFREAQGKNDRVKLIVRHGSYDRSRTFSACYCA